MSTCTANTLGIGAEDSVLPIVPMFHANAWGLPYAALMAGADLVLTDRFLDAKSIIDVIETQRPDRRGCGADHLERRHALPGSVTGPGHLVAATGVVRRVGGAGVADEGVRGRVRRPDPAAVGDDRDLAGGDDGVAAARRVRRGALGAARHPGQADVRRRGPHRRRRRRAAAQRRQGRRRARGPRAVDHRLLLPEPRRRPSSTAAGCAPATSAASTR